MAAANPVTVTGTTAAEMVAAPSGLRRISVKTLSFSNPDPANYASIQLLSAATIIWGPHYVPPGFSDSIPFGVAGSNPRGPANATGVACAAAEALNFQQLNASNTVGVVAHAVYDIELP